MSGTSRMTTMSKRGDRNENENENGLPAPPSTSPRRRKEEELEIPVGDGFQTRKVGAVFVHTPLCSGTVCTNTDPASVQSRRPSCIYSCNPSILLLISWTIISSMNTFTLRDNTQFKRNEPNSQCTKPSQARKQNIDTNSIPLAQEEIPIGA